MKLLSFFIIKLYCTFIYACSSNYCEICSNHTLCLYKNPGPSLKCVGYHQNVILEEDDANAIVDKINERRNFIATGRSKYIPAAANMKKIRWSPELATFAQRWADQCDQSLRPDKEDHCRDLENINVGQNIATIVGSTTSLNIKSFVEIWFMQSMDYSGDIHYYNQSVDYKTNYFTQLIWAETDEVGCGRVKFFIHNAKPVLVERLICNFAPKGNIQGKPVYIVGYPATQCQNNMNADKTFTGLCVTIYLSTKRRPQKKDTSSPATSFLRIRNLYNDSATPEINPVQIYPDPKPNIKGDYEINNHKSKLRDLMKHSYDAVKRSYPLDSEHFWRFQSNNSRNHAEHYQKQKGHSRVYHGHNHKNEFDLLHPETPILDSRRFDFTTNIGNIYSEKEFRKHNVNNYCTRKEESHIITAIECTPCLTKLKCTRGQRNNCQLSTDKCKQHQFLSASDLHTTALCSCNVFQNTYKTSMSCELDHNRNNNCDCSDINWTTKSCQSMLRTLKDLSDDQLNKNNDFNYYDLNSNLHSSIPSMTTKSLYDSWISSKNNMQNLHRRRVFPSDRKRSLQEDEINFRPFWQVDEYSNNKPPQLKSIRFTTLSNKRNKSNKRTRKTTRDPIKTEFITIPAKQQFDKTIKRVTEKYLSFDELLHLRKYNSDLDARRSNDNHTTKATQTTATTTTITTTENTSEYTANTPYVRKKYCTRKLTCTWTAPSITDSAGSIITGRPNGGGSRTPPGYVDGCTRTSTCTRDYMNRNKMATLTVEVTSEETVTGDDDDYCERRSLHRRNVHEDVEPQKNIKQTTFLRKKTFISKNNIYNVKQSSNNTLPLHKTFIFINENFRKKRHDYHRDTSQILNFHKPKRSNENRCDINALSYGDIYYLVSKKIIEMWKTRNESLQHNRLCSCNNVNKFECNPIMVLTIVTKLIIINKIRFF